MTVSLTPDEALALTKECFADPGLFMRSFLGHWFPKPMPWVHRGMLAILLQKTDWLLNFGKEQWPEGEGYWDEKQLSKILRHFVYSLEPEDPLSPKFPLFEAERDDAGNITALHLRSTQRTLAIMPRGVSKTTILNGSNLYKILYKETEFLVYLSETATHAEMQLDNIKRELESNELMRAVFGNKKPERSASEHWSNWLIETTDGIVVVAKGRGGQVRGLNHKGKRPTDIVFDDVEDKESVATEPQRDKARTWMKADVEPALPQIAKSGRIVGLGTVIHREGLLLTLAKDPEWITIRFGAKDPDGDMLWNEYMTSEQFDAKRKSFHRIGKLGDFNMEFQSTTKVDADGAKFPGPFTIKARNFGEFPARALVLDPAIGQKKDSDYSAFAVVGMTNEGFIHVLDVYMQRGMHPREQIDKFFEMHFFYDCTLHGIEAVAYQKALIHLTREEMFRKGKEHGPKAYFEIAPILHGNTAKIPRVEGVMSPRYKAGFVTHQRYFPEYEEQLLDWPNGKKDGPDAVAMAVTLLDPFAAFAFDPGDEDPDKLSKDQLPPLEKVFDGEWRSAI